jgi:hypothetical protein
MGRKNARTQALAAAGAVVRISVALDADAHLRLRLLATMRQVPASDLVADLVRAAVARVRLASTGDDTAAPAA